MNRMRRDVLKLVVLITLLGIPSFGASSTSKELPASKAATLTFTSPTRVGERVLPAGSYQFRCVHKGGYHLMAVRQIHRAGPRGTEAVGKQVATAYCRMETLPHKVTMTSAQTTKDAFGHSVLNEVRIRGEFVRHVFDQPLLLEPAVEVESTIPYSDTLEAPPKN